MNSKETKNIWIGIVVITLIAGAYYFGTTSKNSTSTENIQDVATSVVAPEQPTQTAIKVGIDSKSKCATDGTNFVQTYKQEYGSPKTVWQIPQFHYDLKINTCLVYIGYIVLIHESPLDLSNISNTNASLVVYNFVFDIYSNQAVLQNVANRESVNGKNTDTLSAYTAYPDVSNVDGDIFFSRLKVLMNE